MTSKSKRLSIGLGLFLVFALAAGGAYAYWTNSGSGTGSASTATGSAAFTVSGTAVSGLAPGAGTQPLAGTINNPGSADAYATSLTVSSVTTNQAGCTSADYTVVAPTITGTNIAAGGNLPFSGGTIEFNNTASNQDACKGATVTINYAVN